MSDGKWVTSQGLRSNEQLGYSTTRQELEYEYAIKGTARKLRKAEAAIAQVREVCADQCFWAEHGPDAGLVNAVTVESILDALEGDSDDPAGT